MKRADRIRSRTLYVTASLRCPRRLITVTVLGLLLASVPVPALDNGLARTPPMGWNSWNYFNCSTAFNETTVRGIADAFVSSGMKDVGYQYINLDDCWAEENRDARGALVPNKTRFPNFKGMVDYIHSKGLKIGLYSDVGSQTCAGSMPGSYGNEQRDADSLVSWGIDYLKYDFCGGRDNHYDAPSTYAKMRDCLAKAVVDAKSRGNTAAHDIAFGICEWGANTPWTWGKQTGNLWRVYMDIEIEQGWGRIAEIIDTSANLWSYAGPGAWNDPDMLEVGNGMVVNQDRVHFSIWCMLAAPLIAGNDVRNMSAATRAILTNSEMIAIDQDSLGMQAKRIRNTNGIQVWVKKLRGGDFAVALYNYWANPSNITITWAEIGAAFGETIAATKTFYVRDLWKHQDLGAKTTSFTATSVPTQDIVVVRLSPTAVTAVQPASSGGKLKGLTLLRAAGKVTVSAAARGPMKAAILDVRGVTVLLRSSAGQRFSFDERLLRPGAYVVRLHADGECGEARFVR